MDQGKGESAGAVVGHPGLELVYAARRIAARRQLRVVDGPSHPVWTDDLERAQFKGRARRDKAKLENAKRKRPF